MFIFMSCYLHFSLFLFLLPSLNSISCLSSIPRTEDKQLHFPSYMARRTWLERIKNYSKFLNWEETDESFEDPWRRKTLFSQLVLKCRYLWASFGISLEDTRHIYCGDYRTAWFIIKDLIGWCRSVWGFLSHDHNFFAFSISQNFHDWLKSQCKA